MPAREGHLLAIDVGSTTTRCLLFDLKGYPIAEAYREPQVHHPRPNWTEVAPEDWWTCTTTVVREVLERARLPAQDVLGVGLCGLMHALVPVDTDGQPLARSMLWMDQRCQPQADWLTREHGDLVRACVGGTGKVSTTPSAPKLRWIAEHEPGILRQTSKFLLAKDYVRFKLTGTIATDPSDAGGTHLYDAHCGDWSRQLLELIGVSADQMPPIEDATRVAGGVTEEAARATGLAPGTPVVIGGGDVHCTLVGAHALASDRACLYLGTAAWMSLPPRATSEGGQSTRRFGATSTTGATLKWLLKLFKRSCPDAPADAYAALLREAADAPLGARGLVFLPHLMGERAPQHDPQARGTLYGLTLAHGQGDVARAVLEGCVFQLRRIMENLSPQDIEGMVTVGGGAKSALWLRIIADVLGIPLLIPRVLEAGALGAAILAGVGVGVYPGVQRAAEEIVRIVDRIEPDGARHEQYGRVYRIFSELEDKVAPLYSQTPTAY